MSLGSLRLLGLFVGLVAATVVVGLGLSLSIRVFFPEWYALPGTILQMTGQQVAPAEEPIAPDVPLDQEPPTPVADNATTTADVPAVTVPTPPSTAVPQRTPVPVQAPSSGALLPGRRFNVLLLGSDDDLKFPSSAVLTQAIILVSIDPATKDVAMLSIPRDFWVPISGFGYQKLDVAYEVGGIGLARSTVERLFGIKVDYYAWVGLGGLVRVIDTLGGVDIDVQHPILDETYPDDLNSEDPYAFFRLYIPAGLQHLDGTTALQYVRSRHGDLMSDFGRSARQQQVLLALKNRVESPSVVGQVPRLVAALQGSVKTDLPVPAIVQLALIGRNLPAGSIHEQVLAAPQFASLGNSPDGSQQVVYPDWAAIRPAVARLLNPSASAAGDTNGGTQ